MREIILYYTENNLKTWKWKKLFVFDRNGWMNEYFRFWTELIKIYFHFRIRKIYLISRVFENFKIKYFSDLTPSSSEYRNFPQKSKVWSKYLFLFRNWNVGQKLKLWSEIESLIKNWMFCLKTKIKSLVENSIIIKNRKLGEIFNFWYEIKILVKNGNFGLNRNFGQKSKFWPKIEILVRNRILL